MNDNEFKELEKTKRYKCRFCHPFMGKNHNEFHCVVDGWEDENVKSVSHEDCEQCDKYKKTKENNNMSKEEMINYLLSTGLYDDSKSALFYEKRMMDTDKTVPIKDLIERFIEIDKEFNGQPWNIMQILANIDIIIPVEDRK